MTHDYSPWSDGWGGDTNPLTCCFSALVSEGFGRVLIWRLA